MQAVAKYTSKSKEVIAEWKLYMTERDSETESSKVCTMDDTTDSEVKALKSTVHLMSLLYGDLTPPSKLQHSSKLRIIFVFRFY